MFIVDLNEQTNTIQVKIHNENQSTIVAHGNFAVDKSDQTVLVLFNHIHITPTNHSQLDQFLSIVSSHVGQRYQSLLSIRFPAVFDNRIDITQLEFQNKSSDFMSVTLDHLTYFSEDLFQNKQDQYELITDPQLISNYAQPLVEMMKREAFWSTQWNLVHMYNRIHSATKNVLIIDKQTNLPCGFGRIFLLKTNDELFGYLSDIVVDSPYQSKGLGRILVNSLVEITASPEIKQRNINGTLCLQCAFQGSGAVSAPKLYKRFGFEFIDDIQNRIAIFSNKDNYVQRLE